MTDAQVESIREWAAAIQTDRSLTLDIPDAAALARIRVLLDAYDRVCKDREVLGAKVLALHEEAYEALDACRKANDEAGQANRRATHAAEQVAAAASEVERARREAEQVRGALRAIIGEVDATASSSGPYTVERAVIDRVRPLI